MLEVERTGSGRNGNESVAGAASEAFARWLHHRYVPVELPTTCGRIVSPRDTSFRGIQFPRSLNQRPRVQE